MGIIKIAGIVIVGLILCIVLKSYKNNLTTILSLAISLIIFFYIADRLTDIISQIKALKSFMEVNSTYISVIIKILGITYVTQFTSDVCRDNGHSAMAGQLELLCKLLIAGLTIPIILALFQTVTYAAEPETQMETQNFDYSDMDKIVHDNIDKKIDTKDIVSGILSNDSTSLPQKLLSIGTAVLGNTLKENLAVYIKILSLAVLSSAACCFIPSLNATQISDATKMIITITLFVSLTGVYSVASSVAVETLSTLTDIYKSVIPVFFAAVTYVSGSVSTAAFYQVVVLVITFVNIIYTDVLLKINSAFFLISLSDSITERDRFKKLRELLSKIIKWCCRSFSILIIAISGVKSLIAPSGDALVKSAIIKVIGVIPGIGEAAKSLAGQAWMAANGIKNSIGVVAMIVLIAACLVPVTKLFIMFISYKVAAAVVEPVADSGIVDAVDALGESIGQLLLITASGLFLMLIGITVICMGTNINNAG